MNTTDGKDREQVAEMFFDMERDAVSWRRKAGRAEARVAALEAENAKLREACRAALAYTRYGPFPEFADKEWDRVAVQHMIKDALAHEQEVKRER